MSNKFTEKAEKALNSAVKLAESLGHTYIGTEHILLSLAEDDSSCSAVILKRSKIGKNSLLTAVKEYSGVGVKSVLTSKDTTPRCRRILESSYKISRRYSSEQIGTEHILLALLEERDCVAVKILYKINSDVALLKEEVLSFLRTTERGISSPEPISDTAIPNLSKYGKNLTRLAERGEIEPVIGRERETERLIRILSRKTKNNPCLIGEAGVGKTAIVEGLATRIADGSVPPGLLGKTLISLDLTSMVAGAKYRGDFEERIKNIMSEAAKNTSVILFIDEIHTIVGAGSAEGAIDAANIMKPELSRGNIQLIGATTLKEYRKYIEKDAALERRFQPVTIEEPDVEGTVFILNGIKSRYEEHHKIKIDDSAIRAAAVLSERYIQDRFLPDKAIDVLDEACAKINTNRNNNNEKIRKIQEKLRQLSRDKAAAIAGQNFSLASDLRELERVYAGELTGEVRDATRPDTMPTVTEEHIGEVISEMCGIDLVRLKSPVNTAEMAKRLTDSVVGQSAAVKALSSAVIRSFAGICDTGRPKGVFLFLGESGVGKTELAKALTRELFIDDGALVRYDMSEYSEPYSVSKLIGAAPGYVGYDESTSALERIRKHPYSVILLDEIEKAHKDVIALFLQIFDEGYLTDATGRKINFRNTYIIMTSNIGADNFKESNSLGFRTESAESTIQEKLRSYFSDEFINRIDEVILFSPLRHEALVEIAKMRLEGIRKRIFERGIKLQYDNELPSRLAARVKDKGFGARPLNRFICAGVENAIAEMIVSAELMRGDTARVSLIDEIIKVEKLAPEPVEAT